MTDHVDATLKLWRQSMFIYGRTDCLLSIADYLVTRGTVDIGVRFRGTYRDALGAMGHVDDYGGPQGLLDLFQLPRIDPCEAVRGDIVVLDSGTGPGGCVGALCTGTGVAARLERGVIEVERRFTNLTHAWKVP